MFKKLIFGLLILTTIFSFNLAVFADTTAGPQTYTITVTEKGGKYDFGFIDASFKNGWLTDSITFDVSIYAENGIAYIEFSPDVEKFLKDVHIKVKKSVVTLYEVTTGEMVTIEINRYNFKAKHFSRLVVID